MAQPDEEAWFETARAFIARQYPGMYVVVKNHAVINAYPDFGSAYNAAVGMFGAQGGFIVKQALEKEPVRKV
jgi:hypothetical protein